MTPGFADPTLGAQSSFRAVLHAMAHPGAIVLLPDAPDAPAPLNRAAAALALSLCDADTPLWQDGGAAVADWLRFHTGAPAASSHEARFLIATGTPPALAALGLGSDEAPQDGATLFLQVEALAESEPVEFAKHPDHPEEMAGSSLAMTAGHWRLSGPGIESTTDLHVTGLPSGFVAARAELAPLFPRGLDIVLCAGRCIAALPRTTRIEEAG